MTATPLDPDLIPRFPPGTRIGTEAYNKIASRNSMIDFFAKKDLSRDDRYFKAPYIKHNTIAPDGLGPVHHLAQMAVGWDGVHTIVRRALAKKDLVVLHSSYSNLVNIKCNRVALDIFRFHEGKIVEHWDALEICVAPDESGLGQIDGSFDIRDLAERDRNRAIVISFAETVLIGGKTELFDRFVDTNRSYSRY